jgi:tRNA(Ile)-lysidine synthase
MDVAKLASDEKMSIESVARKYRYGFLTRMAEKYSAKYILTAHHLDDRIETAMFNLIRGTKLGGMHALALLSS